MTPRLTIVMPLRGRNLFTLRFLYHANRMRAPYRFLLADGLVHPAMAELMENPRALFPHLDVDYIRYPDDDSFSYFFNKLADALDRVTTPYAMLADNDDFLGPMGLDKGLSFLDVNPDHVGYSGRILRFSVHERGGDIPGGVTGALNRLSTYYELTNGSDVSVTQRFRNTLFSLWPYYATLRTEALRLVCREVAEISFSDLQIHESYQIMRALTLGRIKLDKAAVSYLRQDGTSLNFSYKKDWIHHLVRSQFTADIDAFVDRLSRAAIDAGADPASIREDMYDMLEMKFRQIVCATYGSLQEIKHMVRRRVPRIIQWYKRRPRLGRRGSEAALVADLRHHGASTVELEKYNKEIDVLRDTLSGSDFATFIQRFVPLFSAYAVPRKASNLE